MKTLRDKLKIAMSVPKDAKWEELTKNEQDVFTDRQVARFLSIIYAHRCFFCKKRFNLPFLIYEKEKARYNGKFLWHLKETHGYDIDSIFFILNEAIK